MSSKKTLKGIFFEATDVQKQQIKKNAMLCGMGQGDYILKRALGYEPKPVPPDAFYLFYDKLCELLNRPLSAETEAAALELFDEIHSKFLGSQKLSKTELKERDAAWQPSGSGLSRTG